MQRASRADLTVFAGVADHRSLRATTRLVGVPSAACSSPNPRPRRRTVANLFGFGRRKPVWWVQGKAAPAPGRAYFRDHTVFLFGDAQYFL